MGTETAPPSVCDLRPLTSAERRRHLRRYVWSSRKPQVLGTVIAVVLLAAAVFLIPRLHPPAEILPVADDWLSWQDNLQTLFGLATLFVAVLVWYNDLADEWAEELPRLLSVYCYHEGLPVLICYHAYLAGESDIRAWSQQIAGRQMTGGDLSFRPVVDSRAIETLTNDRAVFLHHQVRFTLTELPKRLAEASQAAGRSVCLVWHPRHEVRPPATAAAIPSDAAALLPGAAGWPGE
jgi:hypothetical protein